MGPNYRGAMQIINQNLKLLNADYEELSIQVHALLTDCWGPDQQEKAEFLVDQLAHRSDERASAIREMLPVLYKRVPDEPR